MAKPDNGVTVQTASSTNLPRQSKESISVKNMAFIPYGKIYSLVGGGIRTGTKSLSITMGE